MADGGARPYHSVTMRLPVMLLLAVLLPGAANESQAAESAELRSARASAQLLADHAAVAPGQILQVGLRLRLAPGWHTYWRNPGDAGAAPEITLSLPEDVTAGPIAWPAPQRIAFGPLVNFGFTGQVLLPMPVSVPASVQPGDRLRIAAEATWLVCEQICVPETGPFSLDLPVEAAPRAAPSLPLFEAASAAAPRPAPWLATAGFRGGRGSLTLADPSLSPATVRDAFFFPDGESGPGLVHAAAQPASFGEGGLTLALLRNETDPGRPASGPLTGVLVLRDALGAEAAFAIAAPLTELTAPVARPLWQALLFGLLGGLILNLMPCVFPVLAMKAVALARLSGAAGAAIRAQAASYTAGVLTSFIALGAALVLLRHAGLAAGWGFQFTSPAFVALLCWVMLAIGLNLSGVFAVSTRLGGYGAMAARGGHLGSFATGALAVLVATPCSAPFMAAAIGAALTLPPVATLAVFASLGLGLAAPYALLVVAPGLARFLPRPGAWMETLRQALAFPMYASAAWLAWVLAQQTGPAGLGLALGGALLTGFAAWALGTAQRSGAGTGRAPGRVASLVSVLALLALLPGVAASPLAPPLAAGPVSSAAAPWSAERVAALRAEGRPVFVNLTAAWCITCQLNEQLVLRSEAVREAFAARDVALLKGDWTRGDPAISALLRAHGREGVPLYLFYPAGGAAARLLPEILTESMVLQALGT
jgi:thiol:disulfide interchange protein DsbD